MTASPAEAEILERVLREDVSGPHRRRLLDRLAQLRSACDASARQLQLPAEYRRAQAALVAVKAAMVAVERVRANGSSPEPPRAGGYVFEGGTFFPPA